MRNIPPPFKTPMVDDNGYPTREWHRWFQKIGLVNDPFTANPDVIYTGNTTLTSGDLGKVVIFNNGSSDVVCSLMGFAAKDLYNWVRVVRLGTGRLTIVPSALMKIEYGSIGGRIWCDEERRAAANVTLQAVSLIQLAIIASTGRWKVA